MCSVFGAKVNRAADVRVVADQLTLMAVSSEDRGRDGTGVIIIHPTPEPRVNIFRSPERASKCVGELHRFLVENLSEKCIVAGNCRYQPLPQPDSINENARQPILAADVVLTHNGTFPEDDVLIKQYGFPSETGIDSEVLCHLFRLKSDQYERDDQNGEPSGRRNIVGIKNALAELAGGFACALVDLKAPDELHLFRNFKPLVVAWYHKVMEIEVSDPPKDNVYDVLYYNSEQKNLEAGIGKRDWLDLDVRWFDMPAYSGFSIDTSGIEHYWPVESKIMASLPKISNKKRALVICSGGMDSALAAAVASKVEGNETALLHMDYGQRAIDREREAVEAVAKRFGCTVVHVDASYVGKFHSTSPLVRGGDEIPLGVRSSESTLCWTAARNMVFLTLAASYAEGQGYECVYSGAGLEEGSVYPDNTLEFNRKFDLFSEFGTLTRVRTRLAIARLMKTEIVRLAYHLDVPMESTWSCDSSGVLVESLGGMETLLNQPWNKDVDRSKVDMNRQFVPCGIDGCCTTRRWAVRRAGLLDYQVYAAPLNDFPVWWDAPTKPATSTLEELVAEVTKVR
jgi:7-cyano-7-deazaguanine synthase